MSIQKVNNQGTEMTGAKTSINFDKIQEEAWDLFTKGKEREAKGKLGRGLEIALKSVNKRRAGEMLSLLGEFEFESLNLEAAEELLRKALEIQTEKRSLKGRAESLLRLSRISLVKDNPLEALSFAFEGLKLSKELNFELEVFLGEILGDICMEIERYEEAVSFYEKALKKGESFNLSEDSEFLGMKVSLGKAFMETGRSIDAEKVFQEVLKETIIMDKEDERECYHNLALLHSGMQQMDLATSEFEKAINLSDEDRDSKGTILWDLGFHYLDMEDYNKARESFIGLLNFYDLTERHEYVEALTYLASCENELELWNEARGRLEKAYELYKGNEKEDPKLMVEILLGLGFAGVSTGSQSLAFKSFEECQNLAANYHIHDKEQIAIAMLDEIEDMSSVDWAIRASAMQEKEVVPLPEWVKLINFPKEPPEEHHL